MLAPRQMVCALLLAITLCAGLLPQAYGSPGNTPKAYSPFDEPIPRTPPEIIADKRLDQKVKVFCKSRSLKDLFADLSAKTGVRITAARDVCDERVIIFFHARPLRDVMTEVSGLCGYRWMVSGKPDSYAYELFEDTRREDKRAGITAAIKAEQEQTLLDFTRTLAAGGPDADAALDRLKLANPDAYQSLTTPLGKSAMESLSQLGEDMLVLALAGQPAGCMLGDLPPKAQDTILNCVKQSLPSVTDEAIANTRITLERAASATDGMPHFALSITPDKQGSMGVVWPPVNGNDMRKAVGRPIVEDVTGDTSFADQQKITADKLRWLPHAHGLLLGDLLEAIAVQSGKDVISDHYLENEYVEAVRAQPLEQVVRMICKTFRYSCQISGQTMRFRNNRWYAQDPLHEPPATVLEHLWAKLELNGQLGIYDLVEMASLKDDQIKWPGLKFIPGVDDAQDQPYLVRLWGSLSPAQEQQARSAEGLPVRELSASQERAMSDWIATRKVDVSAEDADGAIVLITTPHPDLKDQNGSGYSAYWSGADTSRGANIVTTSRGAKNPYKELSESTFQCLCVKYPSKLMVPSSIRLYKQMDDQERKEAIAQRKADKDAEVVELIH